MIRRALTLILIASGFIMAGVPAAQADPLQSVARQLSRGLTNLKPRRIAVLPFPYHDGDISSGSSIVSERLITLLVERGGSEVVERSLLDKAMGEMRLERTGLIDPATTHQLGKVLGVKAIVTGTLIDLEENETEVNARLIDTETGSILAASTARFKRSWEDLPRPPAPAPSGRYEAEPEGAVHMSKLIPISSPRRFVPSVDMNAAAAPAGGRNQDVLTLTNEDLVPLNHRGQTDPERILNDFVSDPERPSPDNLHMARRIYHRNPDPQVRARALMAMGHLLERSGRPDQAAQAYEQVLREFPDSPTLQAEARRHLVTASFR